MLWIIYFPLDIITSLLAYPLAPLIALLADGDGDVTLGKRSIFRLWLTPDNPIEGDEEHQERWSLFVEKYPKIGKYFERVAWLWRNKAYGWSMKVFNAKISDSDYISYTGDPYVSDKPYKAGKCIAKVSRGFWKTKWMLYWVAPSIFGKCIRVYIGWKMQSAVKQRYEYQQGTRDSIETKNAMYVFSINPLKSRG